MSRSRIKAAALLLLSQLFSLVSAADWQFTQPSYSGSIRECIVSCDKLYVQSPDRMGIQLPQSGASIRYKVITREVDAFKAETRVVGDFAFLFIRTTKQDTANLNRERTPYYSIEIRARVTLPDGQLITSETRVDITILDVNDAPPLFTELSYSIEVADTTPIFSTIGTVLASDADEGVNAEIYYSLEDWSDEFAVHPTTGTVYLTRNLTGTSRRRYDNRVIADNRGQGRQSAAPITFLIVERNQHSPRFVMEPQPPINPYTPEGASVYVFKVS